MDQKKDLRILIIEDDLILTLSLELMLKKMGLSDFLRAETGEKAVDIVQSHQPDLILADISLGPGISGVEAVKIIHESYDIPVIYITGNSDDYNRNIAKETKYIDYLVKPITPSEIRDAIEKIGVQLV